MSGTNAPAQPALDVGAASQTRKGAKQTASGNKSPARPQSSRARKDSSKQAAAKEAAAAKKTQNNNKKKKEECSSQPWTDDKEVTALLQLVGKSRRRGRLNKMGKASVSSNPAACDLFAGFSLRSPFVQQQHSTYMSVCLCAGEVYPTRHSDQQVLP